MKKLLIMLAIASILPSCTSKTEFGNCIGVSRKKEDPSLEYELSIKNAVIGIVFFQIIAPPLYVLRDETYCPIGKK